MINPNNVTRDSVMQISILCGKSKAISDMLHELHNDKLKDRYPMGTCVYCC